MAWWATHARYDAVRDLPLELVSFLEEEGSGFGQMLLGSRIAAQRVTEEELREAFRAIDDGRRFGEHAEEAGYGPARWRAAPAGPGGPGAGGGGRAGGGWPGGWVWARRPGRGGGGAAPRRGARTPTSRRGG